MSGGAPSWLDELHLEPGPPAHVMGTRALDAAEWLQALVGDDALIEAKARVLAEHRDDVVAVFERSAGVVASAAHVIAARLRVPAGGAGFGALEYVATHTAEDLCVLVEREGAWRLDGGVVCFPSMWRIPDKIGLPLALVHDPVPGYAHELASRVDRFLGRLAPDRPVWRRNWFVHDTPELFLPRPPVPRVDVAVPNDLWIRSERQTLYRVSDAPAIVFTIRTQHAPLAAMATRPDLAASMARAMQSWPNELVAYRGASHWRDEAVEWLSDVTRASSP